MNVEQDDINAVKIDDNYLWTEMNDVLYDLCAK